ncbi:BofC C-terminal domain-containing protein [Caldalkalibacillus horti]|uniref:Forespore regulator of the sigma-K checkpoint n=1 Tax=Caldalkalibacillus horti TaxID=77523 RepID=A0ABT9VTE2_9BACI|nr:BofC C-terminal domain-containing protein [Bacillus horti]MDQ0164256.1 forespore regulator of the sigma-K checkpoint [Bacillus horti]
MSALLKKLRRFLRGHKGLVSLGVLLLAIITTMIIGIAQLPEKGMQNTHDEQGDHILEVFWGSSEIKLELVTEYMCGIQTEIKTYDNIEEMEEWVLQHKDQWDHTERHDGVFRMTKFVANDLSPLCKNQGYFGLTEDRILTIYEGPPEQNKIIQTFFRLDTELLESNRSTHELSNLKQGIRIRNVKEYLNVLAKYEQFATDY